jgi:hypothetical protein
MRTSFKRLSTDPDLESDFNALVNQSIRTVVIRNWKDSDFLHTVFLRLNTGSVTLSPQELRQALLPGAFSDFVDETAAKSSALQQLLGLSEPDPRMRDIEILARFLAFRFFADRYPGRMKEFLDFTFSQFNSQWDRYRLEVEQASTDFGVGVESLIRVFGDQVARKPDSRQFNRAIFDALIYYHSQSTVRAALRGKDSRVRKAYQDLFRNEAGFLQAVESDTAGAPNTLARLSLWSKALGRIIKKAPSVPAIPVADASPVKRTRSVKKVGSRTKR